MEGMNSIASSIGKLLGNNQGGADLLTSNVAKDMGAQMQPQHNILDGAVANNQSIPGQSDADMIHAHFGVGRNVLTTA